MPSPVLKVKEQRRNFENFLRLQLQPEGLVEDGHLVRVLFQRMDPHALDAEPERLLGPWVLGILAESLLFCSIRAVGYRPDLDILAKDWFIWTLTTRETCPREFSTNCWTPTGSGIRVVLIYYISHPRSLVFEYQPNFMLCESQKIAAFFGSCHLHILKG